MQADEDRSRAAVGAWPRGTIRLSIAVIFITLLGLSALAWFFTIRQSGMAMAPSLASLARGGDEMMGMSMAGAALPLFVAMWVVMMAAMMFPSVAPVAVVHWRIARQRNEGPLSVPVFVGSYLAVWATIGAAAYLADRFVLHLASSLSMRGASLIGGAALVAAGVYQFTPAKSACLRGCRSPMGFMLQWKPGLAGAARMGARNGAYCVGCCWGLMVALFVLGLANLAWMGVVAAVIFVEKVAPFGPKATKVFGAGLVALGIAMAISPALLGAGPFGG